ncbi:MAG: sugar phosphate isomerase/epimerase [Verrucomicrobia bacterium]|nr:sugar phosphate isomerase/epimerase [Verrucomicrobiota bacterium]
MNRRTFLRSTAALAALAPLASGAVAQPASGTPSAAPAKSKRTNPKGFMYQMLNSETAKKLSTLEKFQLLRNAGFDGVEPPSAMSQAEVLAARDATGLKIPSVCISTHWAKPLSDPNPTAREVGLEGLKQGLRDAKAYGASSVLLVPAVVNKQVSYAEAYARSIAEIKKAVPLAEELGVAIAIENVWNWFLLSPREAADYVDSFKSPFVKWHFDVGNVVSTGWPEQWIQTLGPRIAKVHVKEYSRKLRDSKGLREGFKVDLLAGDSDWPAVMPALDAVGYKGWLIAEQWRAEGLTDQAYLEQLSAKLDAILAV